MSKHPTQRGLPATPDSDAARHPDATNQPAAKSPPPETPSPRTPGPTLETPRLHLRWLTRADAPFLVELVNDPAWLQYIGDRNVHNEQDAQRYLEEGPFHAYHHHGYGPFHVSLQADNAPLGICGLYQRDHLPHPDLGFAFLPQHRRHGYAKEAAQAVLTYARETLRLPKLLAITVPDNQASIRLLESVGFQRQPAKRFEDGAAELLVLGVGLEGTRPLSEEDNEVR